jgi:hypothetical protein
MYFGFFFLFSMILFALPKKYPKTLDEKKLPPADLMHGPLFRLACARLYLGFIDYIWDYLPFLVVGRETQQRTKKCWRFPPLLCFLAKRHHQALDLFTLFACWSGDATRAKGC